MRKCIAALHNSTSRHCSDERYLSVVHIGLGDRQTRGPPPKTRNQIMSIQMNRLLDALASIAIVALGLTIAGATAVVGA